MILCATLLVAGCANPTTSSYCAVAQRPFAWQSDTEIDQAPIRVVRYIEAGAQTWDRLCR